MNEKNRKSWEGEWKTAYDPNFKRRVVGKLLEKMELQGKIGPVVIDIGCGADPISKLIPDQEKTITIDVAGEPEMSDKYLHVRCDIEDLCEKTGPEAKIALGQISSFLKLDPSNDEQIATASTIILSEVLNYVDHKKVLETSARYLRPGGRLVVVNAPTRGYKHLFSDRGLKSNGELLGNLKSQEFIIEHEDYPWEFPGKEEFRDETMLILVARKMLVEG